ncbi:MAG: DUF134 domain-containing protein [Ignavibacteriaceae bacterium]
MGRPKKYRKIKCNPGAMYFKPRGGPMNYLDEIILEADEVEAIRLGDLKGLSQEEAAEKMKISRQTFGRIINRARMKIADGILNGKALRISEDLAGKLSDTLMFTCKGCGYKTRVKRNNILDVCPKC